MYRQLGPYQILKRIGKGGMGDVYLAIDTRRPEAHPHRQLALKLLWHGMDQENAGVLEAELQGAQLQARLYAIDNRVARVFDYGNLEDQFFISMEYLRGRDLAEVLRAGPLEPNLAVHLAMQVADLLTRAHTMRFDHRSHASRGVIHGDIKPRNIRVDGQGRVRLLDFGIAKALSMTRRLTRNEFGSVSYASPERLRDGAVDEHSDLWSLAVVLYECVAGRRPFVAESTQRIDAAIQSGQPPPPLPAQHPVGLRRLLERALTPEPPRRFQDAQALREALEALARQLPAVPEGALLEWVKELEEPELRVDLPQPPSGQQVLPSHRPETAASALEGGAPVELQRTSPARVEEPGATHRSVRAISGAEAELEAAIELAATQTLESAASTDPSLAETVRVNPVAAPHPPGQGGDPAASTPPSSPEAPTLEPVVPLEPRRPGASWHPPPLETRPAPTLEPAPTLVPAPTLEPIRPLEPNRPLEPQRDPHPASDLDFPSESVPEAGTESSDEAGQAGGSLGGAGAVGRLSAELPSILSVAEEVEPHSTGRRFPWTKATGITGAVLLLAGLVGLTVLELRIDRAIPDLVNEINGHTLECDDAWQRAAALRAESLLRPVRPELDEALRRLCEDEVTLVIKRYHADQPGLYKSHWEASNLASQHLLAQGWSARYAAWESYTRGHIARIEDRYDEAFSLFQRAGELDTFCDPYLALMHMYTYSQTKDLLLFQQSQTEAKARGCPPQKKHEIWLADLQYREAELQFRALDEQAMPEELREQLRAARALYLQARETFKINATVGNARKKQRDCDARLKEIDGRLQALEPTPTPEPQSPIRPWFWLRRD